MLAEPDNLHREPPVSAFVMLDGPLQFDTAAEWRAWLERNYAKATEAHVFISKKSVSRGIHYEEALEEALCFGWIDGRLKSHDVERFILRFSPRKPDSPWSESNRARVQSLIRSGRMTPAGLTKIESAKASGAWDQARRPSDVPRMPQDLRDALKAEPTAWPNFQAWGNSSRAACIRWVTGAKEDDTRKRRIRRVVWRAARNKRPGIDGF